MTELASSANYPVVLNASLPPSSTRFWAIPLVGFIAKGIILIPHLIILYVERHFNSLLPPSHRECSEARLPRSPREEQGGMSTPLTLQARTTAPSRIGTDPGHHEAMQAGHHRRPGASASYWARVT